MSAIPELDLLRYSIIACDSQVLADLAEFMKVGLELELNARASDRELPDPKPDDPLWLPLLQTEAQRYCLDPNFSDRLLWHILHEWERLQKQSRKRELGKPYKITAPARQLVVSAATSGISLVLHNIADRLIAALKTEPIKHRLGREIHDPAYEDRRLGELQGLAEEEGLDPDFIKSLFQLIFAESRRLQQQQRRDRQTVVLPDM